jgi:AcrR family transcriptional regulator
MPTRGKKNQLRKRDAITPAKPPSRAGRPRDPDAERSIIAATLELIAEQGFDGVHVADVAERAGVGKTTMYRRWPSKTDLVIAALHTSPPLEPVDTGSLRSDLIELLTQFLDITETTPIAGLLASLAAERQREARFAQLLDPFVAERMRPLVRVLQRAVARGEIDPDSDLGLAASMIGGAIVLRLFFGGAMDVETIQRLTDMLCRSLARPQNGGASD